MVGKSNLRRATLSIYGEQQSLFNVSEQRALSRYNSRTKPHLEIDSEALQTWKAELHRYQCRVRDSQSPRQSALFPIESAVIDPAIIDPFTLDYHNFFFFNLPARHHPEDPCIYFVVDTAVPILLYVGETCQANQRWKGVHDCKHYVLNYQSVHFQHRMPTTINTAFWWDTPAQTKPRQLLESGLIARWKSPFNKENWNFWNTPFVGD